MSHTMGPWLSAKSSFRVQPFFTMLELEPSWVMMIMWGLPKQRLRPMAFQMRNQLQAT